MLYASFAAGIVDVISMIAQFHVVNSFSKIEIKMIMHFQPTMYKNKMSVRPNLRYAYHIIRYYRAKPLSFIRICVSKTNWCIIFNIIFFSNEIIAGVVSIAFAHLHFTLSVQNFVLLVLVYVHNFSFKVISSCLWMHRYTKHGHHLQTADWEWN